MGSNSKIQRMGSNSKIPWMGSNSEISRMGSNSEISPKWAQIPRFCEWAQILRFHEWAKIPRFHELAQILSVHELIGAHFSEICPTNSQIMSWLTIQNSQISLWEFHGGGWKISPNLRKIFMEQRLSSLGNDRWTTCLELLHVVSRWGSHCNAISIYSMSTIRTSQFKKLAVVNPRILKINPRIIWNHMLKNSHFFPIQQN